MGLEKLPQFYSRNGFIYIFNDSDGKWYEIRPAEILPVDVKTQIEKLSEKIKEAK